MRSASTTNSDYTPWPLDKQLRYKEKGYWSNESLYSILQRSPKTTKNSKAIIDGDKIWTYKELERRANTVSNGLCRLGLKSGMNVVLHLPNCGELFEILFAMFRLGIRPVLALPSHRLSEVQYFCRSVSADAYITCDTLNGFDHKSIARKLVTDNPKLKVIIVGNADEFYSYKQLDHVNEEIASGHDQEPVINASEIALFQLSGGTTGSPKLIPRTHNDYYYSIRASAIICGLTHASVYLAVLPVVHNFPLSSPGALGVLWSGGTVVLSQSGDPDTAFELIDKHRVSISALVPPLALTWMNAYEKRKQSTKKPNLKSLRLLQVGGAKFCEEAARRLKPLFGCQLQQVFGMAEGLVNYTRLDDNDKLIAQTQGRPICADDEIRIVDNEDKLLKKGQCGHLLTRGPYTIQGYYKAPQHNAKAFTKDGFYRTGDLARLTQEGYLIVEGRSKDQINRGGEKISAEEIENHLLAHPHIDNAALVSMPDPYLGERSCAFICTKSDYSQPTRSELLKFLVGRDLAAYKIPDRIEFSNALPKTKFGKVDKKELRHWIAQKLNSQSPHKVI